MHCSDIHSLDNNSLIHQFISRALKLELSSLELGVTKIDEDRFFVVKVQDNDRALEDSQIEIHRSYIDVHLVLAGQETLTYAIKPATSAFMDGKEFDNDVEFVESVNNEQSVTLNEGEFVVFYPGEWHRPMVSKSGGQPIHKVVIKIDSSLYNSK
ncbi:YhcH/YjgK/YiaL family protein [Vibrio sp. VB16]|uniref:YhcH/YjgK/YiaL family protein n=1 Tax=Vibrio sp. VB16 TaxID=2785746 RepID=UPI00189F36FF|nr:YhcH/YjgK/YiaL family protein [Vibrio sp. VB16]UGA54871.1 YhcH/YjgK/YiaL family protein [Vibrio sp. VB16]